MDQKYHIADTSQLISPSMIVFERILDDNLKMMIQIAGDPARLRPHCKTHKIPQVTQREVALGITKHKAATFAEAQMLADAGATDIFLAYNPVGPNIARAVSFLATYPRVSFQVTADDREQIGALGAAMVEAGQTIDALLDIDTGLHRTGVSPGPQAERVYEQIAATEGLNAGGLHVYDGQNHQESLDERRAAVDADWKTVAAFRDQLVAQGLPVPRLVVGGTPSFPCYAEMDDPAIELSPGTCVFHDAGYGQQFPDLPFTPAVVILTRVVSRPTPDRMTLDLGVKAVASDPPMGRRVFFPDLPEAEQVLQNEEHLVLKTPHADRYKPGDELMALPWHVCPTTALHQQLTVVRDGKTNGDWHVVARDRRITV